jgi:hypothetical protein
MNERDRIEGEKRVPAQQAQQPQPSKALNDHIQSPLKRTGSEKPDIISELAVKDQLVSPGESAGDEPQKADPAAGGAVDEARFTAGVVKLYEALLKEPIPQEMLRLVDQLGKQERE